jgi:2-hydroxy-3-oxopropionate reductase
MSGAANATLAEIVEGGSGDLMVPQIVDWMVENLRRKSS